MADGRIHFYHNLSVMLAAGVPIKRALEAARPRGKTGRLAAQWAAEVDAGSSLADAARRCGKAMAPLDRTLMAVGEQTGQLAEMAEALSRWYAFRQRLVCMMRSGMLLPLMYIHATALIVPVIASAFSGFNLAVYGRGVLSILAVFYLPAAVIAGILFLTPGQGPLRRLLDRVALSLPLVGGAIRELELSRYSRVFAETYRTGVPIGACASMAAAVVANRVMRAKVDGAGRAVQAGREMSTGFSPSLPGEFLALWRTGEESGDLDEAAQRLADLHADNAEARWTALAQWTPRLIYAMVCLVMIYYIIHGYAQILGRSYTF